MVVVTVGGGFAWEALSAFANLGLLGAAVVAGIYAKRAVDTAREQTAQAKAQHDEALAELRAEHQRSEERHAEQLRTQLRPVLQVTDVIVSRNPDVIPTVTVTNIGVGPARGVTVTIWLAPLQTPIQPETVRALGESIRQNPALHPTRRALVGGLAANGASRVSDLGGGALAVHIPLGHQLAAYWEANCADAYGSEQASAGGSVAVHDTEGNLVHS